MQGSLAASLPLPPLLGWLFRKTINYCVWYPLLSDGSQRGVS